MEESFKCIFLFSIFIFFSTSKILLQIIFILLYIENYRFLFLHLKLSFFFFDTFLLYVYSAVYTLTLNEYYYVHINTTIFKKKNGEEKKYKTLQDPFGPGSGIFTRLLILFYITDLLYYDWVYRLLKPFELLFRNLGYTHSFRFKYFYGLFKGKKACNQSTESNLISVLLLTRILVFFFFFISSSKMKSKYDYKKNWIIDGLV